MNEFDEFDEMISLYEDAIAKSSDASPPDWCCDSPMLIGGSVLVCPTCGRVGDPILVFDIYGGGFCIKRRAIYKRINHFNIKLKEIQGLVFPSSSNHSLIFDVFKDEVITNLEDVRRVLKKNRLSRFRKHTYYIYERITGRRLFRFSHSMVLLFIRDFLSLEKKFTKMKTKRKNLFAYQFTMRKILESNKVAVNDNLSEGKVDYIRVRNNALWDEIVNSR
jgi:hypothetical protein